MTKVTIILCLCNTHIWLHPWQHTVKMSPIICDVILNVTQLLICLEALNIKQKPNTRHSHLTTFKWRHVVFKVQRDTNLVSEFFLWWTDTSFKDWTCKTRNVNWLHLMVIYDIIWALLQFWGNRKPFSNEHII